MDTTRETELLLNELGILSNLLNTLITNMDTTSVLYKTIQDRTIKIIQRLDTWK